MKSLYVIGSLRNREGVTSVANKLRSSLGIEAFDDWLSPGPNADDYWKEYEEQRGHDYLEALDGWAAKHVFEFDKRHLDRVDGAVMVCPSGKSCHLELGYIVGCGKPAFILLDSPERWDVMYQFATGWFMSVDGLVKFLRDADEYLGSFTVQFNAKELSTFFRKYRRVYQNI